MTANSAAPNGLTAGQYNFLLRSLDKARVGKNAKGFAHMEAWDIRRTLTRAFGFGGWNQEAWSDLVTQIDIKPAQETGKMRYTVVYRSKVRLTIKFPDGQTCAVYEASACGDSANQPSCGDAHDNALKTAESQALKRCAINLGDQFGLSLYNGESVDAVINGTLAPPPAVADAKDKTPELPVTEVKPEADASTIHEEIPPPPPPPPAQPIPMARPEQLEELEALWVAVGYPAATHLATRYSLMGRFLNLTGDFGDQIGAPEDLTREQAETILGRLRDRKQQMKGASS